MLSFGCLTVYIFMVLLLLLPLIFAELVTGAFHILGFTPRQAFFLLILSLFGAMVNIPLKKWPAVYKKTRGPATSPFSQLNSMLVPDKKVLAVNLGGAIIPGLISLWQIYRILTRYPPYFPLFLMVLVLNIVISYKISKPVPGKGIAIPLFIPPLVVALPSLLFAPDIAPVIAFPAGVLGVIIGADVLHLKDITSLDGPVMVSIGGAGTFDGIFLCGIIAVFLTG